MQAVLSYTPGKHSREAAYEEPLGVAPSQKLLPASQGPMPAYHTSLQASCVTPTVSENPYAALRTLVGDEGFAHAEPAIHAAPLHVTRGDEVVGSA